MLSKINKYFFHLLKINKLWFIHSFLEYLTDPGLEPVLLVNSFLWEEKEQSKYFKGLLFFLKTFQQNCGIFLVKVDSFFTPFYLTPLWEVNSMLIYRLCHIHLYKRTFWFSHLQIVPDPAILDMLYGQDPSHFELYLKKVDDIVIDRLLSKSPGNLIEDLFTKKS